MANGFNGVMTRQIASEGSRVVQGKRYKFFYNPMWNLFGDGSACPPGTYYQRRSVHKVYFWNILDQVLIRPELLNLFDIEDLAILDHDGTSYLTHKSGHPNKNKYSDHLPLKFKINI